MPSFIIAAIQLNSSDNKSVNLNSMARWTREAVRTGARAVFLPEHAPYLSDHGARENAETLDGPTVSLLRELARENAILLHGGSFFEKIPGEQRCGNTSVVVGPDGEIAAIYRKIHLFDVDLGEMRFRESQSTLPGSESVVCSAAFGMLGLSICYDLRFPALFQNLADKGATVFAVPAAFTQVTGMAHWETLLRARAIENGSYVIAASQWGPHPDNKICYGNSLVVDPWGTVLARAPEGPGLALALLDPEKPMEIRARIPSLAHRRAFT